MATTHLTKDEQEQIAEILKRNANEIARFADEYRREGPVISSVEFALSREIGRIRDLVDLVNPPNPQDD